MAIGISFGMTVGAFLRHELAQFPEKIHLNVGIGVFIYRYGAGSMKARNKANSLKDFSPADCPIYLRSYINPVATFFRAD
jgi:hypothetical protein